MKNVKNNNTARLFVKRKFLLLSLMVGFAFSSCNTYPGFFSWMFSFGKAKQETLSSRISKSFELFKVPLLLTAIAVPGYFLISWLFKGSASNQEPNLGPNLVQSLPVTNFAQNVPVPVGTDKKLDTNFLSQEVVNEKNSKKDVPVEAVPVVVDGQIFPISGSALNNNKVASVNGGNGLPVEAVPADAVPAEAVPGVLLNFSQQRVAQVIEFAGTKNILMGDGVGFEVQLDNRQVARNTVYQLRVNQQYTGLKNYQHSNSCGPRALYNANVLSQVFDNNNAAFINDLNLLADLNSLPGSHENPKLRQMFAAMLSNQAFVRDNITGERRRVVPNIGLYRKVYPENFTVRTEIRQEAGKEIEVPILQNHAMFGKVDPKNLHGQHLEDFIRYCAPENNRQFKFKETDVMDGYTESFDQIRGNKIGLMDFEGRRGESLVGILNRKNIGYFHSYIITEGQVERGSADPDIIGHWIAVFVIKTGENEYSWFVLDSMNNDFADNDQVKAYIYKLLGSVYQEYEDTVIESGKVMVAVGEAASTINRIKKKVSDLKFLNRARLDVNSQIHVREDVERLINNRVGSDFKSNMIRFFNGLIADLNNINLDNKIEELLQFNDFNKLDEKIGQLRNNNKGLKLLIQGLIAEINDFKIDQSIAMGNNFLGFVTHSEHEIERLILAEKEKEVVASNKIRASIKIFLDRNKDVEIRKDVKVPEKLGSEIKEAFGIVKSDKLLKNHIIEWIDAKREYVNSDLKFIDEKEKEDLTKDIEEFVRILNIKA